MYALDVCSNAVCFMIYMSIHICYSLRHMSALQFMHLGVHKNASQA